jgi:hypothetical protein
MIYSECPPKSAFVVQQWASNALPHAKQPEKVTAAAASNKQAWSIFSRHNIITGWPSGSSTKIITASIFDRCRAPASGTAVVAIRGGGGPHAPAWLLR